MDHRAASLAGSELPLEDLVRQIYRVAFSRDPRSEELQTALAYLNEPVLDAAGNSRNEKQSRRENVQDLIWAVMNTNQNEGDEK